MKYLKQPVHRELMYQSRNQPIPMQPHPTPATPANTPNTAGEKVSRWESEPRSSHSPTPSLSHFPTFPPAPLLHLLTCCLLLLSFQAMAAVAPPNDNCNGAIVIPATGATPFVVRTEQLDVTAATPLAASPSEPPLPNTPGFDTNITRSVWYKFTPVTTGLYTVSSGPDTDTTFKDTTMVMYTSPTDCGPFSIYSFNEDSGTLRASISTNLTSGTTYYIVVWVGRLSSPDTATHEVLELQLRVSKPEAPANDTCANPIIIPPNSQLPNSQLPNSQPGYLSPLIDTTLATTTANLTPPASPTAAPAPPATAGSNSPPPPPPPTSSPPGPTPPPFSATTAPSSTTPPSASTPWARAAAARPPARSPVRITALTAPSSSPTSPPTPPTTSSCGTTPPSTSLAKRPCACACHPPPGPPPRPSPCSASAPPERS